MKKSPDSNPLNEEEEGTTSVKILLKAIPMQTADYRTPIRPTDPPWRAFGVVCLHHAPTLEATEEQILTQSPTDAAQFLRRLYGS